MPDSPKAKTPARKQPAAKAKLAAKQATAAAKPAAKKATAKKPAAAKKTPAAAKKTYTNPELREKLKAEILAGDKGGRPGQWSARKAQLLAHEYEAQGGGYAGPKTEAQKHLGEWTDEEWQTKDGKPAARDGETARYLPKAAWDELSESEKQATDKKKRAGSRAGKQFVANTQKAKAARKKASGGGK